jgi:oxygen-dependent protoporphyrinogen oxidase
MSSDSGARRKRVVVVGGGITGLATAFTLVRRYPTLQVVLLEARRRLGGNIVTEERDGFLLDGGPDSFVRTKPDAVELIREVGLGDDLVTPESRRVYVVHHGRLELMPAGLALAVPTRLGPMVKTPLLSMGSKLRMLSDLCLPRGWRAPTDASLDESVEGFITRRFGRGAALQLVGPLLGGIYAGDIARLSMRSTFPQLVELQEKHGSLIRGLFHAQRARAEHAARANPNAATAPQHGSLLSWLRREGDAPSPFYSLRRGMGSLIQALAEALGPDVVCTGVPVRRIERGTDAAAPWRVLVEGMDSVTADAIVLASPAHVAAGLVADEALQAELEAIPYVSTATVFLACRRSEVQSPLDGVGFIVPEGEAKILAATWVTSKWAGRAPGDGVLMRGFVGGARAEVPVEDVSDEDLVELVRAEMERLQGPLGVPLFSRVYRYPRSNPQPVLGHDERLTRIRSRLDGLPGLHVAGAAYEGVGIPDCVRQARDAAERVARDLGAA